MKNFITVKEEIGGETRRVAINLDAVCEIRDDGGNLTFSFGVDNETIAILDDDLRSSLAAHGVVFEKPKAMAEAA